MLERLKPFRYVAAAVFALLVAAVFMNREPQAPPPRPATQPLPESKPADLPQPVSTRPADMRPAPKIGPATLIYKVDTTDRVAFLTIDDGGYRDPAMAGVLKRNGVKATMFVSDDTTLQAAGEAGAKYVVNWGSEIKHGKVHFSGPREFRPGSIVLMHLTPGFETDVNAFVAQARRNGLTPALLTDNLK